MILDVSLWLFVNQKEKEIPLSPIYIYTKNRADNSICARGHGGNTDNGNEVIYREDSNNK